MGARGALPQPDNVRQIRGNPGRRRSVPTPQPVKGVPTQPKWLATEAKAEWKRVAAELERLGLLAHIDRAVLSLYCISWAIAADAARKLSTAGLIVKGAKGERKHPAWQTYREASLLVAALAKELGLSPHARGRMRAPEAPAEDSGDLD